ncbi:phosphatase PAP2 family protein [Nocardia grenadensis]
MFQCAGVGPPARQTCAGTARIAAPASGNSWTTDYIRTNSFRWSAARLCGTTGASPEQPYRLLAAALLLIPALVAAQRLYSGAHHPTDLLGSVLLASIWITVSWWVVRPVPARAATREVSAAGRPPWTGRR